MKIDYEINMRWALADKMFTQIKALSCVESKNIVKEEECNVSFFWEMYPNATFECKAGNAAYKFIDASDTCTFDYDTLKIELDTFIGTDSKVADALKEFEWKADDLKKVFTKTLYENVEKELRRVVKDEKGTIYPIFHDQGVCVISHYLLMNCEEYKNFIGILYYVWAIGVHYLRVKKYQIYAGVACLTILFVIALTMGEGGGSQSVSQTVIIRAGDLR